MDDNKIFGLHSSFYYFGLQHLYINMYQYIKLGLKRNEFICLFTNYDLYDFIRHSPKIDENKILYVQDVSRILNMYKSLELKDIKNKLLKYEKTVTDKGYSGIRFIIDSKHLIDNTSKEEFLKIDSDVTKIISKTRSSVMCIYDFEDYIVDKKTIDDEIMDESYKNHLHRLYNSKLIDSRKLIKI